MLVECCNSKTKMKATPYNEKEANDVYLFTPCKRTIQGPPFPCGDRACGDINVRYSAIAIALG